MVNARAGGVRAGEVAPAARVLETGYHVTLAAPPSLEALRATLARAAADLVVAVGGDGTVNAVVAALAPDAELAVLPIGTANDFARELGVPADPLQAAALIVEQRDDPPHRVDLVEVNGRPFCTVGGVGLVARTTASVAALKSGAGVTRGAAQLLGGSVYRLSTAATLIGGRDLVHPLAVEYREPSGARAQWSGEAHALFVVNHRRCGGGLSLPTDSAGDDGVFELGIVTAGSRGALIANFARLASRAPIGADAFLVRRATEATLRLPHPVPFAADGELLETAAQFALRIRPGALTVRGVRPAGRAGR